jgi:archaeosine synthase
MIKISDLPIIGSLDVGIEEPTIKVINDGYEGRTLNIEGLEINIPRIAINGAITKEHSYIYWNEEVVISKKDQVIPFINLDEIYTNPREVINAFKFIGKVARADQLIFAPNVALPWRIGLLYYLGVSVMDTSLADQFAISGKYLTLFGVENTNNNCKCEYCTTKHSIIGHNRLVLLEELERVKHYNSIGRLREYAEIRSFAEPSSVAILKMLNEQGYNFIEEKTPVIGNISFYSSELSFSRPEVERHRKKISEIAIKPNEKINIAVFFPCSKKKPYSQSQSHMKFNEALSKAGMKWRVHELIVTSPLSLVPREIENYYPVRNYDVPVTGYWDSTEKEITIKVIEGYLKRNPYSIAILHLHKGEMFIKDTVEKYVENVYVTSDHSPTSKESLEKLSDVLSLYRKEYKLSHKDIVHSMLTYQFRKDPFNEMEIKGFFPEYKILKNNKQLGIYTFQGKFSLTLEGAQHLLKQGINVVEIENMNLEGDVFAPAVLNADENIRIGDEVAVSSNGIVKAVGIAKMCGMDMLKAHHGLAVKVRDRV